MEVVRPPAVAGMFYPADKNELERLIKMLLDQNIPSEKFDHIYGIVSPHAGYIYSGGTAAFGYNTVKGKNYETVVVISPSHREYFPGVSIYDGDAYSTPLGVVEVDKVMREALTDNSKIIFTSIQGHRGEHALEVQIPFLQVVLSDFQILPITMGDQSKLFIDELAETLSKIVDEKTLIVASSDLSHFYSREQAEVLDSRIIERINNFDYSGLQNDLNIKNSEACGGGGIVAMMKALDLKNINHAKVLAHTDSGDVSGDTSEVVGYLSAVVYK